MRICTVFLFLANALCSFGQTKRAVVIPDALPLHEDMSADSPVIAELHKGDEVTVGMTMSGSGEARCKVTQSGPDGKSGSVPCSSIRREQVTPDPQPITVTPATSKFLPTTAAKHIPQGFRRTVYLVPIGGYRYINLQALADYYKQKFSLEVQILPAIPFDTASYDSRQRQYVGERLLDLMDRSLPKDVNVITNAVIGITEGDIRLSLYPQWAWALGYRDPLRGRAIISAARMDLKHFVYNTPVDFDTLHRNLAKMTSRYLGFLYYLLPISPNQRSVMRAEMYGIDDLEFVDEEF